MVASVQWVPVGAKARPEFLVFVLAAVLAVGMWLVQASADAHSRDLMDQLETLRSRWSATVETGGSAPGQAAHRPQDVQATLDALSPLVALEPQLAPVVSALGELPLSVTSTATYGFYQTQFDRGLAVLDRIRQRETAAFGGGIGFAVFLAVVAFGLSLRRSWVLQAQATLADEQFHWAQKKSQIEDHERWRIARELHDGVAQDLARAKLNFQQLDCDQCSRAPNRLARQDLAESLDTCLKEVRWICGSLRSDPGVYATFDQTIERCIASAEARYPLAVEWEAVTPVPGTWTSPRLHEVARIVLEALTNVARHAGVNGARVRSMVLGTQVKVMVEDRGLGRQREEGFGMKGIRERVELLGGEVKWEDLPEGGTRMTLTLPLRGAQR